MSWKLQELFRVFGVIITQLVREFELHSRLSVVSFIFSIVYTKAKKKFAIDMEVPPPIEKADEESVSIAEHFMQ